MAYTSLTQVGAIASYAALIDWLTGDPGTHGRDWEIVEDGRVEGLGLCVLHNTGYSGTEHVYVGFKLLDKGDAAHYALAVRVFRGWSVGDSFYDSPLGSPRPTYSSRYATACLSLFSGNTVCFVSSSKSRIVLIAKIGTVFSGAYLGQFLRFASPSEYAYPLACLADGYVTMYSGDEWYTSSSWDYKSAADYDVLSNRGGILWPSSGTGKFRNCMSVCMPGNSWHPVKIAPTETTNTPVVIGYPTGVQTALLPALVMADGQTVGQLDGVCFHPAAANVAESEISVGAENYRLFPRLSDTAYDKFMAVQEA